MFFSKPQTIFSKAENKDVKLILEFWQESELLVLETYKILKKYNLNNKDRILAWGSPEMVKIQTICKETNSEILHASNSGKFFFKN